MNFYCLKYSVIFVIALILFGCNASKKVPDNKYLLSENKLVLPDHVNFKEDNIRSVIRQRPNNKVLGMRIKLLAYNSVDSVKVAEKRKRLNLRIQKKNKRRKAREKRINERRIQRALRKGNSHYRPKTVKLRDSVNPRSFFREWLKYEFGEPPVIFDSLTMSVTRNQMQLYMQRKGYFNAKVSSDFILDEEKKEAVVVYDIDAGDPYIIDSFFVNTNNETIRSLYERYLLEGEYARNKNFRFDADLLASMRKELAEYYRDQSIYGFRSSHISFELDTIGKNKKIDLEMRIAKRKVESGTGEMIDKPFAYTKVNRVYFHFHDTMNYDGNFKKEQLDPRGITVRTARDIPTIDTLHYDWYDGKNREFRTATFLYNGELPLKPEYIEFQNLLEENNYYKGNYVDRSFNNLYQTNQFRGVTPQLIENEDNTIDVHYYLELTKPQSFRAEPRATHTDGFLGVLFSTSYQHKNIFRGGQRLRFSLSGGVEAQQQVFGETDDDNVESTIFEPFNTFEFGPSLELEIPGLYPIPLTKLSKRQHPKTALSLSYNYQGREDFTRNIFQYNYLWKFVDTDRTQSFNIGLPIIGGIQYVEVDKSAAFEQRIEDQNDLFLLNAFSNQFIWKDLKVYYQYSDQDIFDEKYGFSYSFNLDLAGNFLDLLMSNQEPNLDGNKEFLGVRYSQFVRWDNDIRFSRKFKGERSLHLRLQAGAGHPYGNNGLNMPFDYSFFSGGSVDNRGFRARSVGPGTYKYYLDTNRTVTEIGDIRIGGSLEYRFKISGMFKGAIFTDASNIWTVNQDENRMGGQFSSSWYEELAVGAGVGLRVDFDFLVFRLDIGIPIRIPSLPSESQWIFQSRDAYFNEAESFFGPNYEDFLPRNMFVPQLNIAIGYPF